MQLSSDYKDILKIFNRYKVRYLVVGAYALGYYTEPRFTKDLDIWAEATEKNAKRVYEALKVFGAPLKDISVCDFTNKNLIYQVGVAPVRIDIIMGLGKLDFTKAWKNRKKIKYGNIIANIIGAKELIISKECVGRPQDKLDIEKLKKWKV